MRDEHDVNDGTGGLTYTRILLEMLIAFLLLITSAPLHLHPAPRGGRNEKRQDASTFVEIEYEHPTTLCLCRFASRHSISVCYSRPPFKDSLPPSLGLSLHSCPRSEGGRDGKIGDLGLDSITRRN